MSGVRILILLVEEMTMRYVTPLFCLCLTLNAASVTAQEASTKAPATTAAIAPVTTPELAPATPGAAAPTTAPVPAQVLVPTVEPIRVQIIEKDPDYKNRIVFNPLGILLGFGPLTYEREITNYVSVQASPSFVYWGFDEDDDDSLTGLGLGVGVGFFPGGHAPRGMRLSIDMLGGEMWSNHDEVFVLMVRGMAGYNWMWNNGFTMGLHGGVQYWHMDFGDNSFLSEFKGVLPCIDFNIGFAF